MSAAADDTDDLNIRIGPSHSVAVAEVPNIIEHVGKVLRMHMGDAAGADALEILALYWQERADANGPKKVVPWNNTPLGSSHGPRRHPGELQLRRARTLSLIRNHENVEHWPVPVMKFLTRAGGPSDALADENKMLRLCAKAARRTVAIALTTLPQRFAKPKGPVAVSSSLRRSAACWQAEARALDLVGWREYYANKKAQAARNHALDKEIEREDRKKAREARMQEQALRAKAEAEASAAKAAKAAAKAAKEAEARELAARDAAANRIQARIRGQTARAAAMTERQRQAARAVGTQTASSSSTVRAATAPDLLSSREVEFWEDWAAAAESPFDEKAAASRPDAANARRGDAGSSMAAVPNSLGGLPPGSSMAALREPSSGVDGSGFFCWPTHAAETGTGGADTAAGSRASAWDGHIAPSQWFRIDSLAAVHRPTQVAEPVVPGVTPRT